MNLSQLKHLLKRMLGTEGYVLGLSGDDIVGVTQDGFDYIKVSDTKASGTVPQTLTLGAYRTRDINTEDVDTGGDCSVAANQITLAAGTYEVIGHCGAVSPADAHKCRLQNITDGTTTVLGSSEFAPSTAGTVVVTRSFLEGRFTIAAQKVFELQHYVKATALGGNAATFGDSEIYSVVRFRKVA